MKKSLTISWNFVKIALDNVYLMSLYLSYLTKTIDICTRLCFHSNHILKVGVGFWRCFKIA